MVQSPQNVSDTLAEYVLRVQEAPHHDARRLRFLTWVQTAFDVDLNAVQKAAVDSLVAFHRQRMSDLDTEFRPRYRAVIRDLREEIKLVLTVPQRVRYEVLLVEHDAARAERGRGASKR